MSKFNRVIFNLILILSLCSGAWSPSNAFQSDEPPDLPVGMHVTNAGYVGRSQPLKEIAPVSVNFHGLDTVRTLRERLVFPKVQNAQSDDTRDPTPVPTEPLANLSMPVPSTSFEGVNNVSGILPPDTQGDIGYDSATDTKYYVQWVNLAFQIWDVTNPSAPTSVYGPAAGNTLWAGTGTICAANNDGDPITQFDHLANRWMMSQFALDFPNNFHQCIAVSTSADPTGEWYLYDFKTSSSLMNDYPKFGVWPDGYYMTVNQFNGGSEGWEGAGVAVFERSAMLVGSPSSRMIYLDLGAETLDYGGILPSDLDGPAPASGTPNYFVEWDDSTWLGDPTDTLRIWEFHTNWAVPANSTFGLNANYDPNYTIATQNVDPDLCNYSRNCIPQPGGTALDAISDRLMYRLQYRDFGTYQTLLGNHTVDTNGANRAGIHWFELRNNGAGFSMYQQNVFNPDTDHRWMGSAAMDSSGDIALGYSVSSSTTSPSVRYAGRLATDPINSLPQTEASLVVGAGYQSHSSGRWGDYSMMAVDPYDGCTFWYTQEYYAAASTADWRTRIGSFKFPSCTSEQTGEIAGIVSDGTLPIVGAEIEASGGYSTISDETGHYSLILPAGSYDVTASKYGFTTNTVTGLLVTPPNTTTHNFTLAHGSTYTISGVVTDAVTGWPLYARLDIFGFPDGPIFSDPLTGVYSVDLVSSDYSFTVNALSGGYDPIVQPVHVSASAILNFGLTVDLLTCSAPGYLPGESFSENFESWPLTGWTIVDNIGSESLTWAANTTYGDANYTGGSGSAAAVNSDNNQNLPYDTELRSPVIDPAGLSNLKLIYQASYMQNDQEALDLGFKNVSDPDWTNISHWTSDHGTFMDLPGEIVMVDLSSYVSGPFQIRWRYFTPDPAPWDWYAQVDAVRMGTNCDPIPSSGLVIGVIYDDNTDAPILKPALQDTALNQAVIIADTGDLSQDYPLYVIGLVAGLQTLTASAIGYESNSQVVDVTVSSVMQQDFYLQAGMLSTDPAELNFTITSSSPSASQPLTLTNEGNASAGYEIFAIPGVFRGYSPVGPFADHTRHIGPKNLTDMDASELRINLTPTDVTPLASGDLSASWPIGLHQAWGIGFNTDSDSLWLGEIALNGGTDQDVRFTTAGVNTGDTIDISDWVTNWAADMTYNPFTSTLWQVNVGGDNCIYELDPATLNSTGNKICPTFGTSERGLAFDPLSNTYYAGSWNDGIINHFAPDGTLLDSMAVGLSISGLAFNPASGHLFALTNSSSSSDPAFYDVYILDTQDSYTIIGAFNLKNGLVNAFDDYGQAGLEIDCGGNLWAVDRIKQMVYAADSGETGVCDWQADWLNATPAQGNVNELDSTALTASVDATGMANGVYPAYLRIVNTTPYGDQITPVTMTVGVRQYFPIMMLIKPSMPPNGDFELGRTIWSEYSTHGWELVVDSSVLPISPHSSFWAAWLGGDYQDTSSIQQSFWIDPTTPYLTYYHYIASEDSCGYDYASIWVNTTLINTYDLCSLTETNSWVKYVINLSTYINQTISLKIQVYADSFLNSNMFVDDVLMQSAAEALAPDPSEAQTNPAAQALKSEYLVR